MTVYPTGRIVFFDIDGRILYTVKETVDLSLGRNGSTIVFGDLCQITVDILSKITDGVTVYTYTPIDPLANNFDLNVGISQKTNEVLDRLLLIMEACCNNGGGGGIVESVTGNIVDNTDPANPVVTQVQADWNEADNTQPDYIKNKPDLNTLPYIPLSGTAVGSPLTGDIEVDDGVGFVYDDGTYVVELVSQFGRGWMLKMIEIATGDTTYVDMRFDQIIFGSGSSSFIGAAYAGNYSSNFQLSSLIDLRTLKQRLWTKAGAPATSDDNTAGYVVGSLLWDTTNSKMYRATSVTTGSASWTEVFNSGVTDGDKGDVVVSSSGTVWTVEALQTRPVSNTAPTTGQLLVWNGSAWTPTTITDTYVMGNTMGDTINASSTSYYSINGLSTDGAESSRQAIIPVNGTMKSYYLRTNSTQPASGSMVVTVRKNGANTALTFTIAAGTATGTFSVTTDVSVSAGDLVSIQGVNNATAASAIWATHTLLIERTQ